MRTIQFKFRSEKIAAAVLLIASLSLTRVAMAEVPIAEDATGEDTTGEESTVEEATASETAEQVDAAWDKRLVFSSKGEDFTFQPIGLIQPMFTMQINSDESKERLEGSGFSFRRAAIGFNAQMFGIARVFVVANLASGHLALWDYFMDLDFWKKKVVFRMGRFRPWFGRQRLVSAPRFQMVHLSYTLRYMYDLGDGRDLGAGLFGQLGSHFEYGVGVWNGEWRQYNLVSDQKENEYGVIPPGNFDFQVGGRLALHVLKPVPLGEEADLGLDPAPRLTLAVAAMFNPGHDKTLPISETEYSLYEDRELQLGFDGAFKKSGFSLVAEFFAKKNWLGTEDNDIVEQQFKALGLGDWGLGSYLQTGFFLWPRHVELAFRFEYTDTNIQTDGVGLFPSGSLNLYFKGYNLRAQLTYAGQIPVGFSDESEGIPKQQNIYLMLQASI